MSLFSCPECGAMISDKAAACPHCGYTVTPTSTESTPIEQVTTEPAGTIPNDEGFETKDIDAEAKIVKPSKKKLLTLIGIAIAAIVALVIIITLVVANHFDTYEKLGLHCVEKYQNMLKDPDSLTLRSDVILMHVFNGEDDDMSMTEYCFFTASGNNSYGASIISSPCFVDGKYHSLQYFCDLDDIPDEKELLELDDADEVVKYLQVKLAFYKWQLYGENADEECEDVWKVTVVDKNKVARKMGIKAK